MCLPACPQIVHTRTLAMSEDVLGVRVSPDGKLLAVALLDATVKVYYLDSFKFFLSLYGHKLPVLCLDISSDGTLLATGSADKNIKVGRRRRVRPRRPCPALPCPPLHRAAYIKGRRYGFSTAGKEHGGQRVYNI